ncbi:MAG TPA: glucuronate isomerase [Terriglobales bacterium]|jgi:glucuronate isomerase|nr:glucuronate isomerase [Terriglobales bacterium]
MAKRLLDDDRLFPADANTRPIARRLYAAVRDLPIVSPHGHTQARWMLENEAFSDPARLLIIPDHYIFRMLYSQGIPLEELGIGNPSLDDPRRVWGIFAKHYYLFRGTPTRLWLDFALQELFGLEDRLSPENADAYYDAIVTQLQRPEFRPRALYQRFRIEVLATTDSPLDSLAHHEAIRDSPFEGRIIPTFRPDPVIDPDFDQFQENLARLGQVTQQDTGSWRGYLSALRERRLQFKAVGCTATDHGHPTAATADLSPDSAAQLFQRVASGNADPAECEFFRAQMLTEMARMSLDDGLVMQIHPGSYRNHNDQIFRRYGRDAGADIPTPTDYVHALGPLLNRFGNEAGLTVIVFTLDESTYSRELAPLAGHYPCLRLGPAWWFHDSPEGMMRFRELTTETAGFYNTVGFNDDTRAFLSIPARHDVSRRVDCSFLARLVAEHRLDEDEALQVASDLAYGLARKAYKL